jgi:hypothetical protein
MSRKLRIEYPGAMYHVMNRGDQREDIFRDDQDREDTEAGRGQFASLMERRRGEDSGADYEQIRRDWVLGSEAFRQELLAAVVERVGPSHYGAQRQETGLQKAERIVKAEIERLGWREDEL